MHYPPGQQPRGQYPSGQWPSAQGHPVLPAGHRRMPRPPRRRTGLIVTAVVVPLVVMVVMTVTAIGLTIGQRSAPVPPASGNPPIGDPALLAHYTDIRATGPCDVARSDALQKYGPVQKYFLENENDECDGIAGNPNETGDIYDFELHIDQPFTRSDADNGHSEQIGALHGYQQPPIAGRPANRSCTYAIPYPGVARALTLTVLKVPPPAQSQQEWPEKCDAAREYLQSIAQKVDQLPPRQQPPKDTQGVDPCADKDTLTEHFPGWQAHGYEYFNAYSCVIHLTKRAGRPGEALHTDITIEFSVNATPAPTPAPDAPSQPITLNDLSGVQNQHTDPTTTTSCGDALVVAPASDAESYDAHIVNITVTNNARIDDVNAPGADAGNPPPTPPVDCAQTDTLAKDVLAQLHH